MTQRLLVYVASDIEETSIESLKEVVASLAHSGSWTFAPPTFVHEVESDSATRPEDEPVVTIGALLVTSSPGESPPMPVAEARRAIDALARFSEHSRVDFEVELDGVYAGEIRGGEVDRLLREGLLAQW